MKLLHIDSSIQGEGSASRELTREIVARWVAERPDTEVTYLDLAAQELPHLSQKSLVRADELEAARNAEALEQFLAADAIVIGAPVYNFTIPSAQGVDRPHYGRGQDLPLHRERPTRARRRQGGHRGGGARRCAGARCVRGIWRAVSEVPVRIPRHRQREIRAGRGPGDFTAAPRREPERRARRDRRLQRAERAGGLMATRGRTRAAFR